MAPGAHRIVGAQFGRPQAAPSPSTLVQQAIDTIAAAIAFNEITAEESYDAFDTDKDGKLSRQDLRVAIQTLGLGIDEDTASALYATLDDAGHGHIDAAAWVDAIGAAKDVASILDSRGVPVPVGSGDRVQLVSAPMEQGQPNSLQVFRSIYVGDGASENPVSTMPSNGTRDTDLVERSGNTAGL